MKFACLLSIIMVLLGCATPSAIPPKTQAQVQALKTRLYDTGDVNSVLKVLIKALQDDGYIIKTASAELGILTAEKEINIESAVERIITAGLLGPKGRWQKTLVIESTVNVSSLGGKKCQAQANFRSKTFDNEDVVMEVGPIDNAEFYEEFFSKVNASIPSQKENINQK